MKHLLTLIFCLGALLSGFAQMPTTMNYQGVARDASGNPIANQAITVRFTIYQGTPAGTMVYDEDQYNVITTDDKGHFSTTIGDGFVLSGTYSTIDWSAGPYYLEVGLDPTGGLGYTSIGTQQLLTVPYALHAKTAETVLNGGGGEWYVDGVTGNQSNTNSGNLIIGTSTQPTNIFSFGEVQMQDAERLLQVPSWSPVNQRVFAAMFDGKGVNAPLIRYNGLNGNYIDEGVDLDGDYILNTNSVTRMTMLQNGNLGIGTENPGQKLTISDSGEPVVRLERPGTPWDVEMYNSGGALRFRGGADAETSALTDYMTLDAFGRFGIGTTNPASELDVYGTGDVFIAGTSTNGGLVGFDLDNASDGHFQNYVNSGSMYWDNLDSGRFDMTLHKSGGLGLGTTNPTSRLEIHGSSQNIEISNLDETEAGIIFNDAQGITTQFAEIMYNSSSNDLNFKQAGTDVVTVKSSGRVGIGTSSPNATFAVNSTSFGYQEGINLSNGSDDWYLFQDSDKGLRFQDDGTERLVISSTGTMSLNGKFTCEEVEVSLSAFPDYVFEEDYNLMSLEEIEAYIEEYGHLPNVPSAEVIEEEGLGLGELNKILMEKVEELTLHLIEKEQEVSQLEQSFQDQEARLKTLEQLIAAQLKNSLK